MIWSKGFLFTHRILTDDRKNLIHLVTEAMRLHHVKPPSGKEHPWDSFDELKPAKPSPYLVEGVIPHDGLVAVWGPPLSAARASGPST
jgi:hypothetical protein